MADQPLSVVILGGFAVEVDGRPVETGWRLRKAESLVKVLALQPRHEAPGERLLEWLWPDLTPRAGANQLRKALHVARRSLDPDPAAVSRFLVRRGELLALRETWVDATEFERSAERARRERTVEAYRMALEQYGGELLPEDPYEEWVVGERRRLGDEAVMLATELAGLLAAEGDLDAAEARLEWASRSAPWDEAIAASLMRVQALAGRRGRALDTYETLVAALERDLDSRPGVEIQRLAEEVRSGEVGASPAGHSWERIGDLRLAVGDLVGSIDAYRSMLQVTEGARGRRKLAQALAAAHDAGGALTVLDAIDGVASSEEAARIAAIRAHALAESGLVEEATEVVAAALEDAAGLDAPDAVAALHEAGAIVSHYRGAWREGLEDEIGRLHAVGDESVPSRVFDIHHCIGQYHLYGDELWEAVEGFARRTLDAVARAGMLRGEAFAWCLLGESLLLAGRWDEASGCLRRSGEIHESLGRSSGALPWQRLAEAAACRGDHEAVIQHLDRAAAIATVSPMASHLWSRIHATAAFDALEMGEPERARRSVAAAARAAARYGECPSCAALLHPVAAETFGLVGDEDAARHHAERAAAVAETWASSAWRAMAHWAEAGVARSRADGVAVRRSLLAAAEGFEAAGQPFWAARSAGLAAAVVGDDPERLAGAVERLEEMGAERTARRLHAAWHAG
jgi:DNA-binding SARP family transcriptional activator